MKRYRLVIQYDGKEFYGWQNQKNKRTVQGEIEFALAKVFKSHTRITIHGSGRTDSGVHAYGQVAHFDYCTDLSDLVIKKSLNNKLDFDCRISSVLRVSNDFHSRFDALSREYIYQCYLGDSLLFRNQSWFLNKINLSKLNRLARLIIGEHDFLSFSKYNPILNNSKCTILSSEWIKNQNMITYKIVSNRFLHHMIRYLVGTMIAVINNKFSENGYLNLLNNPMKQVKIFKAPPQGLILMKVNYE